MAHSINICMVLRSISKPMNDEQFVELKFDMPPCENGEIRGGEFRVRVDVRDAPLWVIGDTYFNRIRRA